MEGIAYSELSFFEIEKIKRKAKTSKDPVFLYNTYHALHYEKILLESELDKIRKKESKTDMDVMTEKRILKTYEKLYDLMISCDNRLNFLELIK